MFDRAGRGLDALHPLSSLSPSLWKHIVQRGLVLPTTNECLSAFYLLNIKHSLGKENKVQKSEDGGKQTKNILFPS